MNINKRNHRVNVLRKIAEMFWDIPEGYKVKQTCETQNCVNPEHISPYK